jgi:NAD(P)-dependent dehydrogenase (short-subunit alcohol dehydrogenase family)
MSTQMKNRSTIPWFALAAGVAVAAGVVRWTRRIDFQGRVVVIVGGTRGLGFALAREFAAEGARLAICARNEADVTRARDRLRNEGAVDVLAMPCDATEEGDVSRFIQEVTAHFGRIDVLVNNAGAVAVGPMETMTLADYDEAMRIHFHAPLLMTLAVLPVMRAERFGRIVNISSIGGKLAVPHLLPYSASKFALTGFSEGLRAELAKDGILVTTACPSMMRTGSPPKAIFKGRHHQEYTWFAISDALPLLSMSATRAARRIVDAARYGKAEAMLSLQSRLASTFHGVFPGLTAQILSLANRLLPAPGGIGSERALGKESETPITRSRLTALTQSAGREHNQTP